jgi:hypothetical protein
LTKPLENASLGFEEPFKVSVGCPDVAAVDAHIGDDFHAESVELVPAYIFVYTRGMYLYRFAAVVVFAEVTVIVPPPAVESVIDADRDGGNSVVSKEDRVQAPGPPVVVWYVM